MEFTFFRNDISLNGLYSTWKKEKCWKKRNWRIKCRVLWIVDQGSVISPSVAGVSQQSFVLQRRAFKNQSSGWWCYNILPGEPPPSYNEGRTPLPSSCPTTWCRKARHRIPPVCHVWETSAGVPRCLLGWRFKQREGRGCEVWSCGISLWGIL